ncbi:ComEA family DNA-binding protein [Noviherbaspirillum saxi]|uniref:Helix-hairpin-helix domain-containing protein n=1 Tax=Noviherbaspirillum saxi TaxID=2320863 RepID=A0A3A3FPY3_9BURK|nr:helix-hairpin-helix domain-containing protein [Noviherbaspirillum saxi]RJF97933.1 helix-hairpin-helix domain-containing protein [Noviherbaspirillum saxi]
MLKKLLIALSLIITFGTALAQVDVNKADQATLEGIRGVGPKLSKAVLDERKKGGEFKDWSDLESRVKGVGDKSAVRLSNAGLTVNGQSRPGAAPAAKADKPTQAKKDMKKEDAKKDDIKK